MIAAATAFLALMTGSIGAYVAKYGLAVLIRIGPIATACLGGWYLYDASGWLGKVIAMASLVAAFVTGIDVRNALPNLSLSEPPKPAE